jgi:hypothetical protein
MLKKLKLLICYIRGGDSDSEHETVQVIDGVPVDERIIRKGGSRFTEHTHTCCRCGLRHKVRIDVRRTMLSFRYWTMPPKERP